ncbi:hypothetical protein ACIF6K_28430 [Streptomyces sp. NPDC085942]|uniref:hypothetical protein n=1 Tax=Streptomyces sp. NPDC085942 TaxID=3365743 RepID=UPI0037D98E2C
MTVATAAAMVGVLAPIVGADPLPAETDGKTAAVGRFDVAKRDMDERGGAAQTASQPASETASQPAPRADNAAALGSGSRVPPPDAADPAPAGPVRSEGSGPAEQPASTTTSGDSDRLPAADSLPHTASGEEGDAYTPGGHAGGEEHDAYSPGGEEDAYSSGSGEDDAYGSQEPSCPPEPTPTPHPTPTPSEPTPTPTAPTPRPTELTPTPTHPTPHPTDPTPTPTAPTPHPTPTPSEPTPTPTAPTPRPTELTPTPTHPTPHPTPSPSHPGELPGTGAKGGEWILGSIAAALVAAGGSVLVATRRAQRRH